MHILKRSRYLASVLLVVLMAGVPFAACDGHQAAIERRFARVDKGALAEEAATLWGRYRARSVTLPKTEWPPQVRNFDPEKVVVDSSGVYLCTYEFFVRERGLFIAMDPGCDSVGKAAPTYRHLDGSFYLFDIND